MRRRGELVERPFAHYLEAGGMRRTHLRKHGNILKRLLVHVAGFNLGILMRSLIGTGTPREFAELRRDLLGVIVRILDTLARGEQCVCDLTAALKTGQSRLSFHLKTLREAGLLKARRSGRCDSLAQRPAAGVPVRAA